MTLICVPISSVELQEWATNGTLVDPRAGYAATVGLRDAFGIIDEEQSEQVALLVASVAALCRFGRRLVAVVEAAAAPLDGADPDFGEVQVSVLNFTQVTSLFADQSGAISEQRAQAALGMSLVDAWEDPSITDVLGSADLLWHDRSEWRDLLRS